MHYELIHMQSGATVARGTQDRLIAEAQPGELVLRVIDERTAEVVFKREPEPVWAGYCQHAPDNHYRYGRSLT